MPVNVTIQVKGATEEIAKFKRLRSKLSDFTKAMRIIGQEVVTYYSGQGFASQGGVFNQLWPELNPIYAKRKVKDYPGRGLLVATGAMQRSFVAKPTQKNVTITNTAPYFIYHQSTEPRTKMPYRPMMVVNDDVKDIVTQVIEQDIQNKLATL